MLMNSDVNALNTFYLVIKLLINDQRTAQLCPCFILEFFCVGGGGLLR